MRNLHRWRKWINLSFYSIFTAVLSESDDRNPNLKSAENEKSNVKAIHNAIGYVLKS